MIRVLLVEPDPWRHRGLASVLQDAGTFEVSAEADYRKILTLGDDFTVYSGHGNETTIGREKLSNPFLTGGYQMTKGRFL